MKLISIEQTMYTVWGTNHKPCFQVKMRISSDACQSVTAVMQYLGQSEAVCLSLRPGENVCFLCPAVSDRPYDLHIRITDAAGVQISASASIVPRKHWNVCFVPIAHHDYGYTEVIDRLCDTYCKYYENVLDYCQRTDGYPTNAQYRYTVECSWSLLYWLDHQSEHSRERFLKYARAGRIDIMAFYAHLADTACSSEELIRLMYPSFELKRKYGIDIQTASFVDMPGLSWGTPKVLAGAGVKYFFAGMPAYYEWSDGYREHNSGNPVHTFWDEPKIMPKGRPLAFNWEGQDHSKVLAYYQGSYGWLEGALAEDVFGPRNFEKIERVLPDILKDLEERGIEQNCLRFVDHGVDNYPPEILISDIVRRWNETYASPTLYVDTNTGFFQKLDANHLNLPTFSGEIPHTDYNYQAMSSARTQIINNINHALVASAEAASALSAVTINAPNRQQEFSDIYQDIIIYDEHCMGMGHPFGRLYDWDLSSKCHHAFRASGRSNEILNDSIKSIARKVRGHNGDNLIVVFNPAYQARTDLAAVVDFADDPHCDYELEDLQTGEIIPAQIRHIDDPSLPIPYAAGRYSMYQMAQWNCQQSQAELSFIARSVPAYGYRTYRIRTCQQRAIPPAAGLTIENEFYRLTVDEKTGCVSSLWDKTLQREMVDTAAPHQFGRVVVRNTTDEIELPYLNVSASVSQTGPVVQSIVIKASTSVCPQIAVEYLLYGGIKKVDISVRVLKNSDPFYEGFVTFPFAVDQPQLKYDGSNCIPRPFQDQFPGSNTNYYSVQDWAMVKNQEASALVAPMETHIVEFGGLWSNYVSQAHHAIPSKNYFEPFITEDRIKHGQISALLFYNNTRTNFNIAQTGDFLYRFSLLTGDANLNPDSFHQTNVLGLVPYALQANGTGILPESCGLLEIEESNVRGLTCKLAEDGNSLIVRLEERMGQSGTATVHINGFTPYGAELLNLMEERIDAVAVQAQTIRIPIGAYELKTLRIFYQEIPYHSMNWGGLDNSPLLY